MMRLNQQTYHQLIERVRVTAILEGLHHGDIVEYLNGFFLGETVDSAP